MLNIFEQLEQRGYFKPPCKNHHEYFLSNWWVKAVISWILNCTYRGASFCAHRELFKNWSTEIASILWSIPTWGWELRFQYLNFLIVVEFIDFCASSLAQLENDGFVFSLRVDKNSLPRYRESLKKIYLFTLEESEIFKKLLLILDWLSKPSSIPSNSIPFKELLDQAQVLKATKQLELQEKVRRALDVKSEQGE